MHPLTGGIAGLPTIGSKIHWAHSSVPCRPWLEQIERLFHKCTDITSPWVHLHCFVRRYGVCRVSYVNVRWCVSRPAAVPLPTAHFCSCDEGFYCSGGSSSPTPLCEATTDGECETGRRAFKLEQGVDELRTEMENRTVSFENDVLYTDTFVVDASHLLHPPMTQLALPYQEFCH